MIYPCREAFDLFDTDGSGTIDAKELKVAMRRDLADQTLRHLVFHSNCTTNSLCLHLEEICRLFQKSLIDSSIHGTRRVN